MEYYFGYGLSIGSGTLTPQPGYVFVYDHLGRRVYDHLGRTVEVLAQFANS
jgi:hypothetical protein